MFYICYLDWLYPPSVQQRRSCFRPGRSLQFSLLTERTHSSCVSPQLYPFRFCKQRKILRKPDDLLGNLHNEFLSSNFPPRGPGPFHRICTCMSSSTGFRVVSIFWAFEAPQESWDVLLDSLKTIADIHLFGCTELIKYQDVSVYVYSFFAFSDGHSSYICNSVFS